MNCVEVQQKHVLGSSIFITMKDGNTINGILDQIARTFVVIETIDSSARIEIEEIESIVAEAWQDDWNDDLEQLKQKYEEKMKSTNWNLGKPQVQLTYDYLKDKSVPINEYNMEYKKICSMTQCTSRKNKANGLFKKLERLKEKYEDKKIISAMMGYLSYLVNEQTFDLRSCIYYYRQAVICFEYDELWPNLAMASIRSNNDYLAIYGFEKYFSRYDIKTNLNHWLIYIYKVTKLGIIKSLQNVLAHASEEEINYFFEAVIYMLLETKNSTIAKELYLKMKTGKLKRADMMGDLDVLRNQISYKPTYDRFVQIIDESIESGSLYHETIDPPITKGLIYEFVPNQNYGFVIGSDWINYHFHKNELRYTSNEDFDMILKHDYSNSCLPCEIKTYVKTYPRMILDKLIPISNPKTFNITLTSQKTGFVDTLYKKAVSFAEMGEYHRAIQLLRPMVDSAPIALKAQNTLEKWIGCAKIKGLPRGNNPFARAERARLAEKDTPKAIQLYQEAILKQDNEESAIKNLTSLYFGLDRLDEAIDHLKRNNQFVNDRVWFNNTLVNAYSKTGQYDEAISLLQIILKENRYEEKQKSILLNHIGKCFLMKNDFKNAAINFKDALKYAPEDIDIMCNFAQANINLGNLYEAEEIINKLFLCSDGSKCEQLLKQLEERKKHLQKEHNNNVQENNQYKYSTHEILTFIKENTPLIWEKYEAFDVNGGRTPSKELSYEIKASLQLIDQPAKRLEQFIYLAHLYRQISDSKGLLCSFIDCARESVKIAKNIRDYGKQRCFAYEALVLAKFDEKHISDSSDFVEMMLGDFIEGVIYFHNIRHVKECSHQFNWIAENVESKYLDNILNSLVDITYCVIKYNEIDKIADKTQYYSILLTKIEQASNMINRLKYRKYSKVLKHMIAAWRTLAIQESSNLINEPNLVVKFQNNDMKREGTIFLEIYNKGNGIAENVKVTININGKGVVKNGSFREIQSVRGNDRVPLSFECVMNECDDFEVEFFVEYMDIAAKHHVILPSPKTVMKIVTEKQSFRRINDLYGLNAVNKPKQFFGRKKIINDIYENCYSVETNNLLVIHGMRRVGKTSILNFLKNTLEGDTIPVFVDLQETGAYNSMASLVYSTFARGIYEALADYNIKIKEPTLDLFLEEPLLAMDHYLDDIKAAIGKQKVIIMLDEFEELLVGINEGRYPQQLLGWLRSKIQHRNELKFIVAGADKVLEMIFDYAQTIYNMSISIPVSFLEKEEAIELITKPLAGIANFNDSSVERIYNLTNGHPYYTKIICSQIVRLLNKEKRNNIYLSDVERVAENIASDTQSPYFKHLWDSIDKIERIIVAVLAAQLFHPYDTLSFTELMNKTEKYIQVDKGAFNKAITNLEYKNLLIDMNVSTRKSEYRFAIDLVRRWIQVHKPVDRIYMEV
ncbi:ATP-binding protein [Clostridiaceae bacterium 35-E11]